MKYGLSDYAFYEKYEFRFIRPEEAEAAAEIEAICFPPSETCTLDIMKERVSLAGDCFLVAIDRETGRMIGFVNGLCTNEWSLRDELFTDTSPVSYTHLDVYKRQPTDHTKYCLVDGEVVEMPVKKRRFMMGNALVVNLIEQMEPLLSEIFENEE